MFFRNSDSLVRDSVLCLELVAAFPDFKYSFIMSVIVSLCFKVMDCILIFSMMLVSQMFDTMDEMCIIAVPIFWFVCPWEGTLRMISSECEVSQLRVYCRFWIRCVSCTHSTSSLLLAKNIGKEGREDCIPFVLMVAIVKGGCCVCNPDPITLAIRKLGIIIMR